jgi:hypothetical protein
MTKKAPAKKVAAKKVAVKVAAKRPTHAPAAPVVHQAPVAAPVAPAPAVVAEAPAPVSKPTDATVVPIVASRIVEVEQCIRRFMDEDGRVMNVVVDTVGWLRKQLAPFQGAPDEVAP